MKVYEVGGCVRDELMGVKPKDRDWVVVNSSPAEMEQKGEIKIIGGMYNINTGIVDFYK